MSSHANLHRLVLYFQGTKGSPGQAGPAGEQGMRGPQVSEFTAEEKLCLMVLWCYFITATSPKKGTVGIWVFLGVLWSGCPTCHCIPTGQGVACLQSIPQALQHLLPLGSWVCFCPCVLTASLFSPHRVHLARSARQASEESRVSLDPG